MWAQTWENIYSLTVPFPDKTSVDVTEEMKAQVRQSIRFNQVGILIKNCLNKWIGVHAPKDVRGVRRVLHVAGSHPDAGRFLGEFRHRETQRSRNGLPRIRLGLLQRQRL